MSMTCETLNVKDGHGGYYIINAADFDAKLHAPFDAPDEGSNPSTKEMKAALDEKGISYKTNSSKAELQELLDNA